MESTQKNMIHKYLLMSFFLSTSSFFLNVLLNLYHFAVLVLVLFVELSRSTCTCVHTFIHDIHDIHVHTVHECVTKDKPCIQGTI